MKKIFIAIILVLTMSMAVMPVFAARAGTPSKDSGFSDISGHWAEASIVKYADPAVFVGKDGKFLPGRAITRGEFVIMLHKALNIQIKYIKAPDIKEFFNDVSNEDACASNLYDLVVSGIIDHKGSFRPDDALPRDEMIHYIMNALKDVTGGNYAIIKMLPAPFADDEKITPAYKNDIIEAVLLKIISGRGHNMLFPQIGSTRAEAAFVVDRLMSTVKKFNISVDVKPSAEKSATVIKLKLAITNTSGESVTIGHTSGQKYDFALLDSDRNVLYTWSADKMFAMHLTNTVIGAGESVEFTESLDGDTYSSIKDRIKYMKAYVTGKIDSYNFNPDGYEVEVM